MDDLCDLVVLVGADSLMTHVPWGFNMPAIELVLRPEYRTTVLEPEVRIDGSLSESLKALDGSKCKGVSIEEIDSAKQNVLKYFERPSEATFAIQDIVATCRAVLPKDGVVVSETGAFVRMLEHLWEFDRFGVFFGNFGWSDNGPYDSGCSRSKEGPLRIAHDRDWRRRIDLMRLGELEVFAR
ncbi:MAG: hypothetical protein Ct9H300mP19_13890 [Dehalococcoidia bacterium]|nr:MAG: hypothetical protein Ct9H300mP19_13890 [Dehalococcoidia bacterium]